MGNDKNSFKSAFENFVFNRALDKASKDAMHDPENIKLSDEAGEIFDKVRELLPEAHKHLMFDYEALNNAISVIDVEYAYKLGLKDGVLLYKELQPPLIIDAVPFNFSKTA